MPKSFTTTHKVRLDDTDAAGVVFYARLFVFAHHAYEALLEHIHTPIRDLIKAGTLHLPIVHAEADIFAPIRLGDKLDLNFTLERIGRTSFTTRTDLFLPGQISAARVTLVHVALDPKSGSKIELPESLRNRLAPFDAANPPP